MIKVIEKSTAERKQETKELWETVKPRVLNGENLNSVICEVKNVRGLNRNRGWYKDLREYMMSQGYDPYDYMGKRTGGRKSKKREKNE